MDAADNGEVALIESDLTANKFRFNINRLTGFMVVPGYPRSMLL